MTSSYIGIIHIPCKYNSCMEHVYVLLCHIAVYCNRVGHPYFNYLYLTEWFTCMTYGYGYLCDACHNLTIIFAFVMHIVKSKLCAHIRTALVVLFAVLG